MTFPGVDPQLNSFLLQPGGGWESFHTRHINMLQEALDSSLPDTYYAATEKSLQIARLEEPDRPGRTIPDVSIMKTAPGGPTSVSAGQATAPTAVMPLEYELPFEEPEYRAVLIYRFAGGPLPGQLVTRIELLSPANKPGGSNYASYLKRRRETIDGGVNLVEIDYLYHTHPILDAIPSYPRRDPQATPYYVLVSRVRQQVIDFDAVAVDQPLPRLTVPLAEDDTVLLDLQATYRRTVDGSRLFRLLAERPLTDREAFTEADLNTMGQN